MKCTAETGSEMFKNRADSAEQRVLIIRDAIKTLPCRHKDMERGGCECPENKSHRNTSMSAGDALFHETDKNIYF